MKKRVTIFLISCMFLALAACGKTDTTSPENSVSIDTENVEESEETEYTEPEEEFITVDGSTINNATGYHNGYNYVTFNDGTSAVFDKEGMEVAQFPFAMEYEYTKWLSDDLLVVAKDRSSMPRNEEFVLLSISEGITYDSIQDEDHDWEYLGGYGDTILVQRYLQGFNIDATYQIGFTDQYGTEPETWIDSVEHFYYDYDLGDGMYLLYTGDMDDDGMRLCDLSKKAVIPLAESPGVPLSSLGIQDFKTKYSGEYAAFYGETKMDKFGNISPIFDEEMGVSGDEAVYAEGLMGIPYVGVYPDTTAGYFDINGNCIINFNEYTERYSMKVMGAFLNGHTGVILEAKDNGQKYYACFDSKGQLMYEPFFEEDNSANIRLFDGGYYIKHQNQTDTFYDVTGETYQPLVDDMSFLPDNVQFEGQNSYGQYQYSGGIFTVKGDAGTGDYGRYVPCYKFYRKDGTEFSLQMKADSMDGEF